MFETVREANAHLGVAVDGDGDRIIVCNEKGEKVASEQLIAFVAETLKADGKYTGNAVVSTVLSNTALERYVRAMGMEYYSTKVGERAVIAKMQEVGCSVGGEESGHVVVADYSKTGDALVVALFGLYRIVKERPENERNFFRVLPFDPFVFVSPRVASREVVRQAVEDERVKAAVKAAEEKLPAKEEWCCILREPNL